MILSNYIYIYIYIHIYIYGLIVSFMMYIYHESHKQFLPPAAIEVSVTERESRQTREKDLYWRENKRSIPGSGNINI